MKSITELITEMSAIRNRNNDALRKNIADIENQIASNKEADKKRIITGAGLKVDSKTKQTYDMAFEILDTILQAKKPYGAFIYMMYCIYESIRNSSSPNAQAVKEEILKVYDTKAIDEIVSKDAKCKKVKEKLELRIKQADEDDAEARNDYDKTFKRLEEIKNEYPMINDIKDMAQQLLYYNGRELNDKGVLKQIYREYEDSKKSF